MKKISNPKLEGEPPEFNRFRLALSRHFKHVVKEVGILPRALRYFLVLSVALHASLIFVGRQFSSATPKPVEKSRPERSHSAKSPARR